MDITLINAVFDAGQQFSPVGPLYIASALADKGCAVDFREYQHSTFADPLQWKSFHTFIEDSADIIGIGSYSDFLPIIMLAVKELKKRHPEKICILGGEGPTGAAEEILGHFPFIDIIVKGEGERTIVDLMERLESGEDLCRVKGIAYREGERIQVTPPRELVQNLDDVPFPDHSKIDLEKYRMVGITGSRGCPFQCTFCDVAPFWGNRYRARSIGNIIEELKMLKHKYGRDSITFYDEIFTLDRERVLAFCRALKKENLNIKWSCLARIDSMDDELMETMANSGCFMVSFGVESGSDSVQDKMKKKLTERKIKDIITRAARYFEYIQTFFVWGFPFETMDDFHATMDMISYVSGLGTFPTVGYLAPFPFSELYRTNKQSLQFSEEIFRDSHPGYSDEIIRLIEEYPTVFPGFYVWESSQMEKKYEIAKKMGFHTPFLP